MALIDGEYYYRPPAKKTAARKALYYPAPAPKRQQPVVDQYLQNRGYGTIPATQQQYTPPPPAPAKKPPIKIYEDDAVNYGLPGWTMPGLSPTGAPPPGVRQPITIPSYYTRPPNSTSTLRSVAPSKQLAPIYEESATNYGLPGYTVLGTSPTGAPPPGTREPVSLSGLWKGKSFSGNPATANYNVPIYEDQATNYGLPGYTLSGMSPTGAPPPGTPSYPNPPAWLRPGFVKNPVIDLTGFIPAGPIKYNSPPQLNQINSPWASWTMAPTSRTEANAMPGIYRPPMSISDLTKFFANAPHKSYAEMMAELNASGADPWAHDPYDPAGSPYRMEGDGSGLYSGGNTSGGGGGGYGDWSGGGGSYGASSGVSSYLPGAGGGYGARASSPNYTGRGSGRGGSYAGGQYQNQAQWRMPMLVWNI